MKAGNEYFYEDKDAMTGFLIKLRDLLEDKIHEVVVE